MNQQTTLQRYPGISTTAPKQSDLPRAKEQFLSLGIDFSNDKPLVRKPDGKARKRPKKPKLRPLIKQAEPCLAGCEKNTMTSTVKTQPPCNDKANDEYPDWEELEEYPPKVPAHTGLGFVMDTVLMILLKGYGR